MKFKNWFENLAGPGGGMEPYADSPERLGRSNAQKGAGAYKTYGEMPPKSGRSPTRRYLDPRFAKMKKG